MAKGGFSIGDDVVRAHHDGNAAANELAVDSTDNWQLQTPELEEAFVKRLSLERCRGQMHRTSASYTDSRRPRSGCLRPGGPRSARSQSTAARTLPRLTHPLTARLTWCLSAWGRGAPRWQPWRRGRRERAHDEPRLGVASEGARCPSQAAPLPPSDAGSWVRHVTSSG